jgi:hypothetical protein
MKTFRQELRNWLKDKKNSAKSPEENNLFEEEEREEDLDY